MRLSDKPQEQVAPQSGHQSYRFMAYPMQKQKLQLLYPGRPMQSDYHYNGDNIPNEDPRGAYDTKMEIAYLAGIASDTSEAITRHLGGKHPVFDHTSIEPEQPVEDLGDLTTINHLGTRGQSDISVGPSSLPNLTVIHQEGKEAVRENKIGRFTNSTITPPGRYDWETDDLREGYRRTHQDDYQNFRTKPGVHNLQPKEDYSIAIGVGAGMALIAFGALVWMGVDGKRR